MGLVTAHTKHCSFVGSIASIVLILLVALDKSICSMIKCKCRVCVFPIHFTSLILYLNSWI